MKSQGGFLPGSVMSLQANVDIAEISESHDDDDDSDDSSEEEEEPNSRFRGRPLPTEAEVMAEEETSTVDSICSSVQLRRGSSFTIVSVRMEKMDDQILQCDWVSKVTFHDNGLQQLPDDISTLRHLTTLVITSNKLKTLPASVGLLSSLEKIDLNHNELETLPVEMSSLKKLRSLNLDFNKLSEFPAFVFELPELETLSLLENFDIRTFSNSERFQVFNKLTLHIDNVPALVDEWRTLAPKLPNMVLDWHKVFPDQVLDFLFIGSLRTAQEQRVYDDLQITRVVTCGLGMSITLGEGMDQLLLGLADTVDANLSGHLQKGVDYIADAKAKNEKVLVHCFAGLSRSASLVCAYLMREYRWSFEKSLDFIRLARPNACPNDGFVKQLEAFEKQLGITG